MPAGAPPGSNSKFDPKYIGMVQLAVRNGATDQELAADIGVHEDTFRGWRNTHPEFSQALKIGKDVADQRVERSLYQKAIGFKYLTQKAFMYRGEIKVVEVVEYNPPDTTSIIFWLKNRKPQVWRDMRQIEMGAPGSFEAMADDELEAEILRKAAEIGVLPPKTSVLIEYDASAKVPGKSKPKLVKSDEDQS